MAHRVPNAKIRTQYAVSLQRTFPSIVDSHIFPVYHARHTTRGGGACARVGSAERYRRVEVKRAWSCHRSVANVSMRGYNGDTALELAISGVTLVWSIYYSPRGHQDQ